MKPSTALWVTDDEMLARLGLADAAGRAAITQVQLIELLNYNPETGIFTYKATRGRHLTGSVAGTINDRGYRKIKIDGRSYSAGRLALLYMTGELPREVDHRNGMRMDDRFENLRLATRRQQAQNRKARKDSSSGFKGVRKRTDRELFIASIRVDGKTIFLGLFKTPQEAHAAYTAAAEKHFGAFARAR